MRISNQLIQQSTLANIQRNLKQIHTATTRVATQQRMLKASDDPVGASESMRARSSMRALEQYRRAVQTGISRAATEEQALDQVTGILTRARELATLYGSDNSDADARRIGQIEVEGLLRHAITVANTRFDDGHFFGGLDTSTPPFSLDASGPALGYTSAGSTGQLTIEISERQRIVSHRNGTEVFEDTGVLSSLRDLAAALEANDPAAIRATMRDLDTAFQATQALLGDVGSRTNLLEMTAANLDALEMNLRIVRSEIEEVDIEEAMTELISRQTSFQAALLATSQVMNLTLANYLR